MMEKLRTKLTSEGEQEAATYNTFACFCRDTMASTSAAITAAQGSKDNLEASLGSATLARGNADTAIGAAQQAIVGFKGQIEGLSTTRHTDLMAYEKNEIDLTAAIQGLEAAIQHLKAAKTATSFLEMTQMQPLWTTVQRAISLAFLVEGFSAEQAPIASSLQLILQQQGTVAKHQGKTPVDATEQYAFHSDDIIGTLDGLLTSFRNKKGEIDGAETTARNSYDLAVQALEGSITTKEGEVTTEQGNLARETGQVVTVSKDLSATAAQLLDDQQLLAELSEKCNSKAVLWDERTQSRMAELSALTHASQVLQTLTAPNGTALLEERTAHATVALHRVLLAEPPAEAAAPSLASDFLQVAEEPHHASQDWRSTLTQTLRHRAAQLQSSTLLKIAETAEVDLAANSAGGDPFSKVKVMIQSLIERLLREAASEADKKGYCDKEMALAMQSRNQHTEALADLNSRLEVGEAHHAQLELVVQNLETDLAKLNQTLNESTTLRQSEEQEHAQAIQDANESRVVVAEVLDTLQKFYAAAANNASKDTNFVQTGAHQPTGAFLQRRASSPATNVTTNVTTNATTEREPTPDAGFDEAYGGAQDGPMSVVAILEVIVSDFESTMAETQKLEATSEREYRELQTQLLSSQAEKEVIQTDRVAALSAANQTNTEDMTSLVSSQDQLDLVLGEMIALHNRCFTPEETAAERKVKRDEEMEALQQALCVLDNHGLASDVGC